MNRFTPGPWHYVKHSWSDTGVYGDGDIVAMLKISEDIDEDQQERFETEQEANAMLVSAAPELYEALELIINDLPSRRGWLNPEYEKMARHVLAKARGEKEP